MNDLQILSLKITDASDLARLLTADEPDYRKYFVLSDTTVESLSALLAGVRQDRYWGIKSHTNLVGLFMLRGFDEGYRVPSFGVYIAQAYSGKGLSKLALYFALAWCRMNDREEIMLSVHPDNVYARRIYEDTGFQFTGQYSKIGHWIYKKSLLS